MEIIILEYLVNLFNNSNNKILLGDSSLSQIYDPEYYGVKDFIIGKKGEKRAFDVLELL